MDAQTPENQFTLAEKSELLTFAEDAEVGSSCIQQQTSEASVTEALRLLLEGVPDKPMQILLQQNSNMFAAIEDHHRFLEDKVEDHLNETEAAEAEAEYMRDEQPDIAPLPPRDASLFSHHVGDRRAVIRYPFCPNALNPYHECSSYCLGRYAPAAAPLHTPAPVLDQLLPSIHSVTPSKFHLGDRIVIVGFTRLPFLNGKQGFVKAFDVADDRYTIEFDNNDLLSVKEVNLAAADSIQEIDSD